MRNKYNYGELVKISGMGKNFGEVKNRLGFIIRKDDYATSSYCGTGLRKLLVTQAR